MTTISEMCNERKMFKTRDSAASAYRAMVARGNTVERFPVACSHCGKWHLARSGEKW